jgi:hypothetical protein
MTEWYVLILGKVQRIILGRHEAVREAIRIGHPTRDELTRARKFLEAGVCDPGTGIRFAGRIDQDTGKLEPDVELVRALGPGSEV